MSTEPFKYAEHERREAERLRNLARERKDRLHRACRAVVDVLAALPDVTRVIVFGSTASGQGTFTSDLDIAVAGLAPEALTPLWLEVERAADGIPFDLIRWEDASDALRAVIEAEGVIVFERPPQDG